MIALQEGGHVLEILLCYFLIVCIDNFFFFSSQGCVRIKGTCALASARELLAGGGEKNEL